MTTLTQLNANTSRYHRRIVFDEFFLLQTILALKKKGVALEQGLELSIADTELNTLIKQSALRPDRSATAGSCRNPR